jgi:phage FluMu protein Com
MYCEICGALLYENTSENKLVYECPRGHVVNIKIDPRNTLIFSINRTLPEFRGRFLENIIHDRSHAFVDSPCKCGAQYRKFSRTAGYKPMYICVCGLVE